MHQGAMKNSAYANRPMQSFLQTWLLTNLFSGCTIHTISYTVQVPPALLWSWRRIVNPVRIRNGTATVCEEAPHGTKVSHWDLSWEGSAGLTIRESGDLLEQVTCAFCVIMEWTVYSSWKNGHGSAMLPWPFYVHWRFADCRLQTASDLNSPKIIRRYLISLKIKQILRKLAKTAWFFIACVI